MNTNHLHIDIQNVCDYAVENTPIELDMPIMPPWNFASYFFTFVVKHIPPMPVRVDVSIDKAEGEHNMGDGTEYIAEYEIYPQKKNIIEPSITYIIPLSKDGNKVNNGFSIPGELFNSAVKNGIIDDGEIANNMTRILGNIAAIVSLSNAFAHCKNVELINKPMTRQQRRMIDRKGGIKYKTLAIEPFKTQVRNEAVQSGESEIKRALHICRGHFATYTDDKPLFGKYSGTFWKPMHVKGSKKAGVVVKDYKVDP